MPAWTDALLKLNGITDPNLVVAGQTLQLPAQATDNSQPVQAANGATSNPSPPSLPGAATGIYVVQGGDSLFSIATKLGVGADLQAAWAARVSALNGIEAAVIAPGQTLRLP